MTRNDGQTTTRRVGGRAQRTARPARDTTWQRHLTNPYEPARAMSDDEVEHLHERALTYLQTSGLRVLLPEARRRFAAAGAHVDDGTQMVRIDVDHLRALLAAAPREFTLHARNPANDQRIGGTNVQFVPVGGPPFSSDRLRGRRVGSFDDFANFVRLTQRSDLLHLHCSTIEAQDLPMALRHLHTLHAQLTLSDKVPVVHGRGRAHVADCHAMIRVALGLTEEEFQATPVSWLNINTNSPRQLDVPMCLAIIDCALAGQATVMTPFTLAGAMAPVTLSGALLLQHIEALAAIALAQIVRPGTPVVYGAFTSNVDMRSGSPAFGTPESFRATIASGQLARHLGVPWRSQATSTSLTEDSQGAYETMVSLMSALMGGANIVIHAAGWQEGGLVASFEKFVLDVEALGIVADGMRPLVVDEASLAVDAIDAVGPGGHFFGAEHTLERFETAFHEPAIFTRQNIGQWIESGSLTAEDRATAVCQRWLAEFEPPPMDVERRAALDDHVARRIAEGGCLPES